MLHNARETAILGSDHRATAPTADTTRCMNRTKPPVRIGATTLARVPDTRDPAAAAGQPPISPDAPGAPDRLAEAQTLLEEGASTQVECDNVRAPVFPER